VKLGQLQHFAIATAIVIAVIVYGSLYPFVFGPAGDGIEPALRALWETRAERPGRINFLANILLYMPLGFCAIRTWVAGAAPSEGWCSSPFSERF
jgi:hypothetical protein